MQKLLIITLSLITSLLPALSDIERAELHFKRYTKESGLPSNSSFMTLRGSHGFIWFATTSGLSRFDGQGFKNFRFNPGVEGSLSNDRVRAVIEDISNPELLWIATQLGGINSFNKSNEKFTTYRNNIDNNIISMAQDDEGILWLGTEKKGLLRFDPETNTFDPIYEPDGLINSILVTKDTLWLGANNLVKVDKSNYNSITLGPGKSNIRSVFMDSEGTVWLTTAGHGLYYYNNTGLTKVETVDSQLYGISEDSKGNLWIGTYRNGIMQYDTKTGKSKLFSYSKNNTDSIISNRIYSTYYDNKENIIWIKFL